MQAGGAGGAGAAARSKGMGCKVEKENYACMHACRLAAQAALVELLEEAGLPPVCAALAVEDDADKQLGTVLAEAVQVWTLHALHFKRQYCLASSDEPLRG